MIELLITVGPYLIVIFSILSVLSLFLLRKEIEGVVDPTGKLKDLPKAERLFIRSLFDRIKMLRDAESYCEVTENGIFTGLSKSEMTSKLYWKRQVKFVLTALIVGTLITLVFHSPMATTSVVLMIFYAAMTDGFLVKVIMNNLLLLKE